jgi:hypothetical protein
MAKWALERSHPAMRTPAELLSKLDRVRITLKFAAKSAQSSPFLCGRNATFQGTFAIKSIPLQNLFQRFGRRPSGESSADSGLRRWGLKVKERLGFKRAAVAGVRDIAGGRADLCYRERGCQFVVEVKQEVNGASFDTLIERYGGQTTQYQAANIRLGVSACS